MRKKRKQISQLYYAINDYLLIALGLVLYAFGWTAFILSNEIVTGGVTGICALIFFSTGLPVSVSYIAINIVLLIIAFKVLGAKYLIKTVFGVVGLSVLLTLFQSVFTEPILKGEPAMAIVIGGILCGAGLGLIFSGNGSSGGTDIVASIVNKYRNISIGRALIFCDFIIIGSSYFLFHSVDKIVFSFVEMLVCNYVLDMVLNGNRQSVQFFIFSPKYDEICERIISDIGRGCTILDGTGGYSHKSVKVVVVLAKKSESVAIFRLVKQIDNKAFISQSSVRGVYGEGFDPIKT
ncbi:YitT family protein [Macellibacteroides fermentans]|uniref:YitT family protein n=1 Tax=Macellibacteroides fermentans TaxID=879969 RepID=UPI00083393B4|nr:hypothetical protein A9168_05385 [Macellibacteroides sp. HH-ZS]